MKLQKLEKDGYYHIFNRGINGELVFRNAENKRYFLSLVKKYLAPYVSVLAFCLMDNHFHFLIRIDAEEKQATRALSNLFNAYAKAFNRQENRTGSLFEKHFRRKKIEDESYLRNLVIYIHRNPENHGITDDFTSYPFSSYQQILQTQGKNIVEIGQEEVVPLFDSKENFRFCHREAVELGEEEGEDLQEGEGLQGFRNLAGRGNLAGRKNLTGHGTIKQKFQKHIQTLQETITSKLEKIDGKAKFREDVWERPQGGGGRTRIIENGAVFEKGGVNISAVHGELSPAMENYFKVENVDFFACGLSLVLHPKNPMVPTAHANWRYFEMYDKQGKKLDCWFGGGQDLTPSYLFEEDARHFHGVCKKVCDRYDPEFYPEFKKKCDAYFWNSHRDEARGIGGLFFDYCKPASPADRENKEKSIENWYDFVTDSGNHFLESYLPIVEKRKHLSFSEANREWQEIRRGRYVEFNLIHDKGTLFGLKTNGRIESILMSLPPHVQWVYDHHPKPGSEEEKLVEILKRPRNWV